eukprot:14622970-Alexandrium_andersonii.AAC.1
MTDLIIETCTGIISDTMAHELVQGSPYAGVPNARGGLIPTKDWRSAHTLMDRFRANGPYTSL